MNGCIPLVCLNTNGEKPEFRSEKFRKGLRFLCTFCGGKSCRHENYKLNPNNAIRGLHCNWITHDILAMQRPSSRIIREFDLVSEFKKIGMNAVFCLQEPGEHPFCGDGIHGSSGLSYLPEELNSTGIFFYNFGWRDHQTTDASYLIKIIKTMELALANNQKVAVHCHAGKGRTALVICAFLVYRREFTAQEAINLFKKNRHDSFNRKSQKETLFSFELFLKETEARNFTGETIDSAIKKERILAKIGEDIRLPIIVQAILQRLLALKNIENEAEILESFYRTPTSEKGREIIVNDFELQIAELKAMAAKNPLSVENCSNLFVLAQSFIDLFESFPNPAIRSSTLQTIQWLKKHQRNVDSKFWLNIRSYKQPKNYEIALFDTIHSFFSKLKDVENNIKIRALRRIYLALTKDSEHYQDCFFGRDLIGDHFEHNIQLKAFESYFHEVLGSLEESRLFQSSIDIWNSPLKTLAIKKKSFLISKTIHKDDEEKQIIDHFGSLDPKAQADLLSYFSENLYKKSHLSGSAIDDSVSELPAESIIEDEPF